MAKWLSVDPGEDTGWALWDGDELVTAGTEKLWPFADMVWRGLNGEVEDPDFTAIKQLVVEDFRIYPWDAKAGNLNWDQVRTARLIGALTFMARAYGLKFILQPAKIKERAEAAGAAELFYKPLHENRHQNDAIRHGVYRLAMERGASPIIEDDDGDPC